MSVDHLVSLASTGPSAGSLNQIIMIMIMIIIIIIIILITIIIIIIIIITNL